MPHYMHPQHDASAGLSTEQQLKTTAWKRHEVRLLHLSIRLPNSNHTTPLHPGSTQALPVTMKPVSLPQVWTNLLNAYLEEAMLSVPDWDTEETNHELHRVLRSVDHIEEKTQHIITSTMIQVSLELSDSCGDSNEDSVREELTLHLIRQAKMNSGYRGRINFTMPAWSTHFSTPFRTKRVQELSPPSSDGPPQHGATMLITEEVSESNLCLVPYSPSPPSSPIKFDTTPGVAQAVQKGLQQSMWFLSWS